MKKIFLSFAMMVLPLLVSAYDFEVNGICYTVTSFEEFTVAVDGFNESLSGTIEIPSSITYSNKTFTVTSIKSGKSDRITSVLMPSSITEIGSYAFGGSSIQKIEIPDNVTSIGYAAFKGCTQLHSIRISKNVTNLKYELFEGCTNLTNIDWHPETTYGSIEGRVFYDCTSLKTIRIPAEVSLSGGLVDNYHVTIFKNCTSLDSLIIEDGESTVTVNYNFNWQWSHGEFYGSKINYVYLGRSFEDNSVHTAILRYVEHLEIGDKVTVLPTWLPTGQNYSDAKHLKTLVIGSSLTEVADFSNTDNFDGTRGNQSLEFIKMKGTTPPEAVGFSNYNYINTILYVPKGSKSAYESANIWKNFWNIQEYSDDGTEIDPSDTRNDQSMTLATLPTMTYGEAAYSLPTKTVEGQALTWSVTDEDIATINGYVLSIKKAGTTVIIASQNGNDTYKPFSKKYTLTINKASLKIIANDAIKQEGDDNPVLTVRYSGFKYNDNASSLESQPVVTTTAKKDSPVGTYPITVNGAASENYTFTYVNGTLTVKAKGKPNTNNLGIVIETAGGERTEYALTETPKLTYDGNTVTLTTTKVSVDFTATDIVKVVLTDVSATGIDAAETMQGKVLLSNDEVRMSGLVAHETVQLYNMNGVLLSTWQASSNGDLSINLSDLQRGVYIIKANHQSFKVTRK